MGNSTHDGLSELPTPDLGVRDTTRRPCDGETRQLGSEGGGWGKFISWNGAIWANGSESLRWSRLWRMAKISDGCS